MASYSLPLLISLYLTSQMQIGLHALMTGRALVVTNTYYIFMGPNLILWSSTKQWVVSRSMTESKYHGLAYAITEVLWLKTQFHELCIPSSSPPALICDNINALHLATNPILHARTKHIVIDYHFVRKPVLDKMQLVEFAPSIDQLVDIMKKPLSSSRFSALRSKLTVCLILFTWGGIIKWR